MRKNLLFNVTILIGICYFIFYIISSTISINNVEEKQQEPNIIYKEKDIVYEKNPSEITEIVSVENVSPVESSNVNNHVYPCTKSEQRFFEQILAAESNKNWSYQDMLSLATVVINRYNNSDFPNSFDEIFKEDIQFETFSNKSYLDAVVTDECRNAVEDALNGKTNLNSDVLYFCTKGYYDSCANDDFFKTNVKHVYTCRNVYFFEERK